jgi:hypothetical protein
MPKLARLDYSAKPNFSTGELREFDNSRTHNITLASFVIVLLAVILAFPQNAIEDKIKQNVDSLLYFSISMSCFFIASYLFTLQTMRWFPYLGDILEITGILSLGIGFLVLISKLVNDPRLYVVYFIFLASLVFLATITTYYERRIFFPKKNNVSNDNVITAASITLVAASTLAFFLLLNR